MKPIERGEILGLAEYEQIRERFRARVIAQKKRRRVLVGDSVSVMFENRDTVLLQIQEMLRTERITRAEAVQHEIDTYNELVPAAGEVSCTLMVEIEDKGRRDAFLVAAKELEKHVWLVAGSYRMGARSIDRPGTDERTTAVHYLRFTVPAVLAKALAGAASGDATMTHLELAIDHPAYTASVPLPVEAALELGQDLGA
ncbi:MAG TPA: DUF3501 family protein [Polyangiaceae bacterium]|jgi:hypothetical protein